jgi:hypothetical protein
MPSRLTVVLLSLLLAAPTVIFWLWLVIQPERLAIECSEECRCELDGLYVNCSSAGLDSIPSNVTTNVRLLQFDKNNLTYFKNHSFCCIGLVELEILYADFCKLITIELGAFNGLKKLTHLSMRGNEISEIIPGTFERISRLEYLDLSYKRIEHLESDVLSGLVKLKSINLGVNKLQILHPDTFVGIPKLQTVILFRNSGLQIPTDHNFINLNSLKQLSMSVCIVHSLSGETFANVSALELLDLSYNNLRSVDINILKALPNLSQICLYANPLQCDCQLQEVWRWCQDHNIQTAYKGKAPVCDRPSEVKGIWWGVLENDQCLQDNIYYYGDYENTSYSYTMVEDSKKSTERETKQFHNTFTPYQLPVTAILFLFGATFNIILIIIITANKDMRTVPNMYILNLAVRDIIILTMLFFYACASRFPVIWAHYDFKCGFPQFCGRMSVGLSAYSIAVYNIQRYRLTVNPLQFHASSHAPWRATVSTICGVWIVAALFALPAARSNYVFCKSILLLHKNYYKLLTIFHLFVSCLIPLCVIAFSYTVTARRLMESSCPTSEGTENPQVNTRKNTAKVLLGLTVVLLISYVPFHITEKYFYFSIISDVSFVRFIDVYSTPDNLISIVQNKILLFSINSCLNPVALFCTSRAFRRHFKRYLTCCCKTNSPPTDFEFTNRN